MKKIILASALALTVTACAPGSWLDKNQPTVASVCSELVGLSSIAGPYAMWVESACVGEAMLAKLALDPTSVAWLEDLKAKIKAL